MIARRVVSLPLAFLAFPILAVLSPLLLVIALLSDLVLAPRRLPSARLLLAVIGYAFWTLCVLVAIFVVWVLCVFGLRNWHPTTQARWHGLTRLWLKMNVGWFGPTLGYRVEVTDHAHLHSGPLLVFARHQSIFDALLPPRLVTESPDMVVRVLLMRELRNEPNLDMVGHRAPHHFVERSGDDPSAEIAAVGRLATNLPADTAVVIFPEGRLFRPKVRERVIERLDQSDYVAAARARELRHLLPPRPGGALALLDAAPADSDVAFIGHIGFDQLTDPLTVWRSIPLRDPIEVVVVRRPASDVPAGDDDRIAWIHEQWKQLDDWIDARRVERSSPPA